MTKQQTARSIIAQLNAVRLSVFGDSTVDYDIINDFHRLLGEALGATWGQT